VRYTFLNARARANHSHVTRPNITKRNINIVIIVFFFPSRYFTKNKKNRLKKCKRKGNFTCVWCKIRCVILILVLCNYIKMATDHIFSSSHPFFSIRFFLLFFLSNSKVKKYTNSLSLSLLKKILSICYCYSASTPVRSGEESFACPMGLRPIVLVISTLYYYIIFYEYYVEK